MNTRNMKFLAVLAVFAMAFASFAVLSNDVDTSDATVDPQGAVPGEFANAGMFTTPKMTAENLTVSGVSGGSIGFYFDDHVSVTSEVSGKDYTVTLDGYSANNTISVPLDWGNTKGYAFFYVDVQNLNLTGVGEKYLWVYQKNAALGTAPSNSSNTRAIGGTTFSERISGSQLSSYNNTYDGCGYGILIPQNGEDITLEFYSYSSARAGTAADFTTLETIKSDASN